MKLFLSLVLAAGFALAADPPRIFYSKSFPGSAPPYVEITLDQSGRIEYREAPKEEDPLISQMTEEDVKQVWALAERLDWFRKSLESGLKVARMGDKTFRMENHDQKGEAKFNFTQDEDGKAILDWFERMTESAQYRIQLEKTVRFDKLGVNKALLQLEAAWDRKRLVAPNQYLPMLDRVVKNESYLQMARTRAAYLADQFRNGGKAKTE
jgi:predicted DCC family thiol-disulfide oxidoreductase YuxK